jgi:predicted phosphodiesterase
MRIAVISDIHAAADPFGAALAAARKAGFDQLLLLGDLLTYGVQPKETLDLVHQAIERDGALLVRGNHDQVYLDREQGCVSYELTMPDWIRESVDWTCSQLSGEPGLRSLAWLDEWQMDGLLAAHANPFSRGDWSYLREAPDMFAALDALTKRGFRAGIFGHTHRFRNHEAGGRSVTTVGSVGQPRDAARASEWTLIQWAKDKVRAERRCVDVDWGTLVSAIRATGLSDKAKDRICRFYS